MRKRTTRWPAGYEMALTERQVQTRCLALLRLTGWTCWRIGQHNARGTMDPGVPDVFAAHPTHGALWIECKREKGGKQSDAQKKFQRHAEAAGVTYLLVTDAEQLVDYMNRKGAA